MKKYHNSKIDIIIPAYKAQSTNLRTLSSIACQTILSDLEGGKVKAYEIEIEDIRKNGGKEHKDLQIRITDERLLKLTGGIVQGMSGSPILQNGRFVGAVTYVMLNQPERGYGIFLEHMTGH